MVYDLTGLINNWPAAAVGGVPVKPSYSWDPVAVLARLCWTDHAIWVPGHANRWNNHFVLVYVTPDENDRRTETGLWLHWTDVARVVPAEPSRGPMPPDEPISRARPEARRQAPSLRSNRTGRSDARPRH
ncbi:hypothetical protein GCM10010413_36580 [Promicromonospora sukumoe]